MSIKNLLDKFLNMEIPGTKGTIPKNDSITGGVGITLSSASQKEEDEKFREIAEGIIGDLSNSGFFKPEAIPGLAEKVRRTVLPGYAYKDPFSYDDCLMLDEKKVLGLNPRQKFSRGFVDTLTPAGLTQPDPKRILEILYYRNFHAISGKYELSRLKRDGIKKVKISDCGDDRDCSMVKKMAAKVWPINEVPALPLPGCTAEYCRCSYIMDEKSMFD
jgi:hypothetical protein